MIFEILLTFFFCYLVAIFVRHLNYRRAINQQLPGLPGWPLIGNPASHSKYPRGFFQLAVEVSQQFADTGIMKVWTGHVPSIYVYKANTVEDMMNSTRHIEKSIYYLCLLPWLREGLLTSGGKKWQKRRKLITPTFHFKILEEFAHVFNEQSRDLVRHLGNMSDRGQAFDIQPFMYRCMLDAICEAAMGVKVNAQNDHNSVYVRSVYRITALILARMVRPWMWNDFIYGLTSDGKEHNKCLRCLHGFTEKVIRERLAERAELRSTNQRTDKVQDNGIEGVKMSYGSKRRLAFLDMLLEASDNESIRLTPADIQEEVDTFMFEGHDTTASGAVWLLYMLACYPDIQQRLLDEINSVLGDGDGDMTLDDVNKLRFMECFVKETFRLYPPVPWYSRTTSEPCTIGGYSLPKDVPVTILAYQLHRDPEHFPDPEKFDPDRWMDDAQSSRHPFCYVPFSGGMRNCIGQRFAMLEERVMLCHVLRNFNLSCSVNREDIVPFGSLILRPETPVNILLRRR